MEINNPENLLSPEFNVAVEIYALEHTNPYEAYYSRLVERLDGTVSKVTVSKALDVLLDAGILKAEWKKTPSGKWARIFTIAGEAEGVIKETYEFLQLVKTNE